MSVFINLFYFDPCSSPKTKTLNVFLLFNKNYFRGKPIRFWFYVTRYL